MLTSVVIIKLNMLHYSNLALFSYIATHIQMGMVNILKIYHIIYSFNQIQTGCQHI